MYLTKLTKSFGNKEGTLIACAREDPRALPTAGGAYHSKTGVQIRMVPERQELKSPKNHIFHLQESNVQHQ